MWLQKAESTWETEAGVSVSSRLAWTTKRISGQPGLLKEKPCLENQANNKANRENTAGHKGVPVSNLGFLHWPQSHNAGAQWPSAVHILAVFKAESQAPELIPNGIGDSEIQNSHVFASVSGSLYSRSSNWKGLMNHNHSP